MKKLFTTPLAGFLGGTIMGGMLVFQLAFTGSKQTVKTGIQQNSTYKWYAPTLPSHIAFAGEPVPLDRWEVREEFDRQLLFNYYMQGNILYLLKLANRYFPLIEERLVANGVPDDFKYLCVAESSLQNVVSKAGAVGFWQFMDYSGPGYSLEIGKDVDLRYNVLKSTDAACVYLKQAHAKFGSWTAAAASYNCGQGRYADQASFQKTTNYYDLALPEETNRYIFRILTFKYLLQNAAEMGYVLEKKQLYPALDTRIISVSSSISNLAEFAARKGTNYKMLKLLNPWLRSRALAVRPGKTYELILPRTNGQSAQ